MKKRLYSLAIISLMPMFVEAFSFKLLQEPFQVAGKWTRKTLKVAGISDFGETHFIVGKRFYAPPEKKRKSAVQPAPAKPSLDLPAQGSVKQFHFSSTSNICDILCRAINDEPQEIYVAMYSFTHKQLAQALIDAHKKGVKVTVILDVSCLTDPYSKAQMLSDAGVSVLVRAKERQGIRKGLMHLKVLYRKGKRDGFCGSYNYTKSASELNDDFIAYFNDAVAADEWEQQFKQLIAGSKSYTKVALHSDMRK